MTRCISAWMSTGKASLSRRTRPAKPEGTGAQLSHHHQRRRTGDVTREGDLSQLGHSLYRQAGLCTAASCGVAGENHRARGTPPGGVLLPTARRAEVLAAGSSARTAGGKQETPSVETALPDSLDRSDPGSCVAGHPADPASVSHQATAVDLRRSGH